MNPAVLTMVAALPIVVVLVLMVAVKWSAARAGIIAGLIALVAALTVYDFGGDGDPFTPVEGVAGVLARAAWVAFTVILIIGPALGIHHLQQRTGATLRLEAGLARITPDPRVAALLIVWFFTLFIEGAAGFGTPVALAAPFLVAAGFKPVAAVTAAIVGHTGAVTFGAVGTPTLAQAATSDYSPAELAWAAAPYQVVVGVVLAIVVARLLGTLIPTHGAPWAWMAIAYVLFFVPFTLIARFVGPELPGLGGALVGALAFVALVQLVQRRRLRAHEPVVAREDLPASAALEHAEEDLEARMPASMSMLRAGAPYLLLVALVLVTRLVPPLQDAARSVSVRWEVFGEFSGDIEPFYHPGLLLLIAFIGGGLIQAAGNDGLKHAFVKATRQLVPVSIALVAMVTVAFSMSYSGMTDQLALTAAGSGAAWPLFAPAIGALGTFITGSATASNILFTEFQDRTATEIGLEQLPLLGAQNSGAAIGSVICPHNVVAAAATVGLSGREGEVLKRTLPVALVAMLVAGLYALLIS
ncbi:MAG: L-lactate permease [Actinobacteria bacterium HGW-Actinobacteria-4]|nr:MAG: L-lactate permease [Actinobacteria bacterium HGW-Actinobacteria-4]